MLSICNNGEFPEGWSDIFAARSFASGESPDFEERAGLQCGADFLLSSEQALHW